MEYWTPTHNNTEAGRTCAVQVSELGPSPLVADHVIDEETSRQIASLPLLVQAAECALSYFQETRHGREWTETGGMEANALERAFKSFNGQRTTTHGVFCDCTECNRGDNK